MPRTSLRPLVVIVENDAPLAIALAMLVDDWGYTAVLAKSPKAVMHAVGTRVKEIRAIITDYHLDDGFTGIKGATAIANAVGHRVPTIVTTGHAVLAEHEDVFPVLWKPFDPGVLYRWLETHVDRKPAPSAA